MKSAFGSMLSVLVVYGLMLACPGGHRLPLSPSPVTPMARVMSEVDMNTDTSADEQTMNLNPKNPLVQVSVWYVHSHGVLVGACLFGAVADSTLISFPGNGVECGRFYERWTSYRRTARPRR